MNPEERETNTKPKDSEVEINSDLIGNQGVRIEGISVALFALAICLSHIHQGSIAVDAVRYAQIAQNILLRGNYFELFDSYTNSVYHNKPPLMFWLLASSFKLFGFSTFVAKLPSAIFASCSIFLFWLCAKTIFDRKTALTAVMLYCLNRYFSRDLVDLNFESMAVCGALLCLLSISYIVKSREHGWNWILFLVGTFLLSQSKPPYLAFVFLPTLLALYQAKLLRSAFSRISFWLAIAIPIIASSLWYLLAQKSSLSSTMDNQLLEPMRLNVSYERNILNWIIAYFSGFAPLSILGLFGIVKLIRKKEIPQNTEFLLIFWILPIAPIILIASSRERYLALPMLSIGLLAAFVLAPRISFSTKTMRRSLLVLACSAILLFSIIWGKSTPRKLSNCGPQRQPQPSTGRSPPLRQGRPKLS
jgi:4-amino-4-deoxy-L-arabinose transferase-like glycosyltransferase